ncbi:MAG TPA: response regulator, partial [Pirellulales bacterium]|nr:response regulator [Pirellulales bacterium]
VLLDCHMPEMDGFMLVENIKRHPRLQETVLMMLSSAAQYNDVQKCHNLGVAAYLTKPIKQSELLDTILLLLHPPQAAPSADQQALAVVQNPVQAGPRWNILLAEDNPVNQRVAAGILGKHGHVVTAVENGLEALQAAKTQRFDLVLMDLQMPEMDGFAATSAIRELEADSGQHLPIVAMTARAMKGDRECCLQAGMDDYLAKPVNPKELLAVIESLLSKQITENRRVAAPNNHSTDKHVAAANQSPSPTSMLGESPTGIPLTIDFAALLARVENDNALLEEMIELYLESSPRLLTEIESGIRQFDAPLVQRAAHSLKGALHNLSAEAGAQAAQKLEKLGNSGDLSFAEPSLAVLQAELKRLQAELTRWSQEVFI